jgi:hypothetical protein
MTSDENHPMAKWILKRFKTHPQEFEILKIRDSLSQSIFNEWKTRHIPTGLRTEGCCLYTWDASRDVPDEILSVGLELEKVVEEWYRSYQRPKQNAEMEERLKKSRERSDLFWDQKFKEVTNE